MTRNNKMRTVRRRRAGVSNQWTVTSCEKAAPLLIDLTKDTEPDVLNLPAPDPVSVPSPEPYSIHTRDPTPELEYPPEMYYPVRVKVACRLSTVRLQLAQIEYLDEEPLKLLELMVSILSKQAKKTTLLRYHTQAAVVHMNNESESDLSNWEI
ncbi:hypothetical protein B0O80DRAFT_486284 [Mortierella sp. GBAus27b]|nr:hypothetical protein BGX31_002652 [Mortierella sp. GBA43]KAI8356562.1 hypothetical protein B0O80DRAFT_486284 [Mortierella sp. GBAus27b]